MASAARLRRKASRLHRRAGCWFVSPARAKHLTVRAWNYSAAARLEEREERDRERAARCCAMEAESLRLRQQREEREAYARQVADLPPTWTQAEREARIRAYDTLHGRLA